MKPAWVKPGAKVYLASHDRGRVIAIDSTIVKVGRKWAYVQAWQSHVERFALDDRLTEDSIAIHLDGGKWSSPGVVWRSREDYEESMRRRDAIAEMRRLAVSRDVENLPIETAEQVVKLLRQAETA